jgi:hypothetical protein
MRHLVSRKFMGFHAAPIHRRKEPSPFHFLAQRTSFWIAALSLFAFVTGNMIGQHGWQVFWRSVLGRDDDSLIVYTGTVTPIAFVPDYGRWAQYGGNPQDHTYREVPKDALIPMPAYTSGKLEGALQHIISVAYMGSYATGDPGSGSHPAVDIRVPVGTPVRSIANGVVSEVKDGGGFGKTVVIRHPHMPDPDQPSRQTTLYSCYAHLSAIFISEGATVGKGEQIALSGATGDVSGPHLHFQIDRDDAPWHPYWPFTTDELRAQGLSTVQAVNEGFGSARGYAYTVNPLLYVQANYAPTAVVENTTQKSSSSVPVSSVQTWAARMQERIARAKATRIARRETVAASLVQPSLSSSFPSSAPSPAMVVERKEVVIAGTDAAAPVVSPSQTNVASVEITHDGSYSDRGWERIRLTLLDAQGNVVQHPVLDRDIALRTAYGSAEFESPILSVLDFQGGRAEVGMLPLGRRTVIVQVMPFNVLSAPMRYSKS